MFAASRRRLASRRPPPLGRFGLIIRRFAASPRFQPGLGACNRGRLGQSFALSFHTSATAAEADAKRGDAAKRRMRIDRSPSTIIRTAPMAEAEVKRDM